MLINYAPILTLYPELCATSCNNMDFISTTIIICKGRAAVDSHFNEHSDPNISVPKNNLVQIAQGKRLRAQNSCFSLKNAKICSFFGAWLLF